MTGFEVGDKVRFSNERQAYTVQAANEHFAICTKPFNPLKTVLYTIVDFKKQIRGTENLVFCFGFEAREQCKRALARLTDGETKLSHRNWIPLRVAS